MKLTWGFMWEDIKLQMQKFCYAEKTYQLLSWRQDFLEPHLYSNPLRDKGLAMQDPFV